MTTPNEIEPVALAESSDGGRCAVDAGSGFQEYQPEIWAVKKDDIYAAIHAVQNGLEYARECLTMHDTNLGRTTYKNKSWAEQMEEDIQHMERTLAALRLCPNDPDQPRPENLKTK